MAVTEQGGTATTVDVTLMYLTHDAFRRDLARMAVAAEEGRAQSPGVRAGWANFKRQLHVHHTVEDAQLWPRVVRAVVDSPTDLRLMTEMEGEHAGLEALLAAVDREMTPATVGALSAGLRRHMAHEEEDALPLIQRVLTDKDWGAFRSGMARAQGPRGAAVYVPWVVDDASPEARHAFFERMPAPLTVLNRFLFEGRYLRRRLWQ